MPIAIVGLQSAAGARPTSLVSPLVELGSALHVLHDPAHHDADEWAAHVRVAMTPRLAGWTNAWAWTTQAIRSGPFVTVPPEVDDFADLLDALRALPPKRLAEQLFRPISRSGDPRVALHWSRSRGPAVSAIVETLVERPHVAVSDFLAFLERSWHEWFSVEWARIRPSLVARARRFTDTVATYGAAAALTTLDTAIRVSAEGAGVTIAKLQNTRRDVAQRGLVVAPSAFIAPHLYVADVSAQPLLLVHPVGAGAPGLSVSVLMNRLNSVAHRGRLEVARAIATEPRTAGEIAALWGIDPTLVNRHLRSLASAGLACTTRRGRFVQYSLDTDALRALGTDLLSLLLR